METNPLHMPSIGHARSCARQILKDLKITQLPVKLAPIIEELSKYDLLSVKGTSDFQKIDGIIIRKEDEIEIYYNKNKHVHRQRFTVAHELGHHVLGHVNKSYNYTDFTSDRKEEIEANEFAAELLIPLEHLKKEFKSTPNIKKLAYKFWVSEIALTEKLKNSNLLK